MTGVVRPMGRVEHGLGIECDANSPSSGAIPAKNVHE